MSIDLRRGLRRYATASGGCAALLLAACEPASPPATPVATAAAIADPAPIADADGWIRAMKSAPTPAMPALNPLVIDRLAEAKPELAQLREELATRETQAVSEVLALPPRAGLVPAPVARNAGAVSTAERLIDWLMPRADAAAPSIRDVPGLSAIAPATASFVFTTTMGGLADQDNDTRKNAARRSEVRGESGARASLEVRRQDARTTVTLDTNVDAHLFLLEAGSKIAVTTRSLCPDASGVVEFTIRLDQQGQAGPNGALRYTGSREATVRINVNDNAEISDAVIDTRYAESFNANGRPVFLEAKMSWNVGAGGSLADSTNSREYLLRYSQQAQDDDLPRLLEARDQSLQMGRAALTAAEKYWQGGACIGIEASSPGRVARQQVTQIPVQVVHKFDGGPVAARVVASLTGGASLSPAVLPRSPGTLTHVAPDAARASMSIDLTANSRRGRATRSLAMSIGSARFLVKGGADEFEGTGIVCDFTRPFEVEGNGITVRFNPGSERAGTYRYQGSTSGFRVQGNGTYVVDFRDEIPVRIRATGPGSVSTTQGTVTGKGDEIYSVTPSPEGACN